MARFALAAFSMVLLSCSGPAEVSVLSLESSGPAQGATPLLTEDFSTYTSTADMLSNPRGIYMDWEDVRTDRMVLDTQVGANGGSKSLRYDYPANGVDARDYTISRSLSIPGNPAEVWVEALIRFSNNFRIDAGAPVGAAFKLLHVAIPYELTGGGRFGLGMENGDSGNLNGEGPNDAYTELYLPGSVSPLELFDGDWHSVRFHIRLSGSQDTHEFWVDGKFQGSRTGDTAADYVYAVSLAKNLNQGPLQAQSMWWGGIRIWDRSPGW